jgi:4-hydroxy-2-oxoheptanedioate aldolase
MEETTRPPLNPLKAKLRAGKPTTGAMITMPSVGAMQIWARSGIDMLVIDLEHSPIGIESVHALVAATHGYHGVPVVRVPWNVPWLVKPVLDAGAMGVCFPMIDSAEEAAAAVRSVRYPPAGERGWGPFYAHLRWDASLPEYVARASDENLVCIIIEQPAAVANIEAIAATPGIDLLFVAPFDLSMTMGYPMQPDHPEVVRAVERVEDVVLRSGVPLGGVAPTREAALRMLDRGYLAIHLGFDWMVLQRAAAALLDGLPL